MGAAPLYSVGSPFNASELSELDATQSFDVMYLAHLNHAPSKLQRFAHTNWQFVDVAFGPTNAAPANVVATATNPNVDADNAGNAYAPMPASYVVTSVDATTGQESRPSAASDATNDLSLKRNFNTVEWDAVTGSSRYRIYKADNTGDLGFIGSTAELSFVDAFIAADLTTGPPVGRNPFDVAGDWPSTVTFFEQRLWWGRTTNNPNALYSSRSADFENMDVSEPLRADDAITVRLVSQGVNEINQLVPLGGLLAFSSGGIVRIKGSNDDYLSASPPPGQKPESGRQSSRLSPIVIDTMAFYKTLNSSEVRAAGYRFEVDGVKSNNMCIFSPDLFEGFDIVSWAYTQEPLSVIWAARSDGTLLAFTWEEEQQVWGWTVCPLPRGGQVKSVCSVPELGADGAAEDRIYAIVSFEFEGGRREVRCRMASSRWQGLHYACHLDCSITRVLAEPGAVFSGLWHLEGETVTAFADGLEHPDLVVSGGKITLPEGYVASVATIGFPYNAEVETLPLYLASSGTNVGRKQQAGKVLIKLTRSRAPQIGLRDPARGPVYRDIKTGNQTPLNLDASLLEGDYEINADPVVPGRQTVVLRHSVSPLHVTAIYIDPIITGG